MPAGSCRVPPPSQVVWVARLPCERHGLSDQVNANGAPALHAASSTVSKPQPPCGAMIEARPCDRACPAQSQSTELAFGLHPCPFGKRHNRCLDTQGCRPPAHRHARSPFNRHPHTTGAPPLRCTFLSNLNAWTTVRGRAHPPLPSARAHPPSRLRWATRPRHSAPTAPQAVSPPASTLRPPFGDRRHLCVYGTTPRPTFGTPSQTMHKTCADQIAPRHFTSNIPSFKAPYVHGVTHLAPLWCYRHLAPRTLRLPPPRSQCPPRPSGGRCALLRGASSAFAPRHCTLPFNCFKAPGTQRGSPSRSTAAQQCAPQPDHAQVTS